MKSKGQGIKIVSSSHIIAKQRKIFLCFPNSNHIIVMPSNIKCMKTFCGNTCTLWAIVLLWGLMSRVGSISSWGRLCPISTCRRMPSISSCRRRTSITTRRRTITTSRRRPSIATCRRWSSITTLRRCLTIWLWAITPRGRRNAIGSPRNNPWGNSWDNGKQFAKGLLLVLETP